MKIISEVGNVEIGEAYIKMTADGTCYIEMIINEKGVIKTLAHFIPVTKPVMKDRICITKLDNKVQAIAERVDTLSAIHKLPTPPYSGIKTKKDSYDICDYVIDNMNNDPISAN